MILIYSNPQSWVHPMFLHQREQLSDAERQSRLGQLGDLLQEIAESGELVGSGALSDPLNTRTVTVREGAPEVTDGPFGEAKEQLAGYFLVDCESMERATEIAARFPDARDCAVEVRPLMDPSGLEM
ncbi:YciI family protein [Promicromonospora aerolata]|uniref:YciI family protein n=1 Tax=Promicromonospora aerolata TaxID=195749 RepID=A0ABW4V481_9MICO